MVISQGRLRGGRGKGEGATPKEGWNQEPPNLDLEFCDHNIIRGVFVFCIVHDIVVSDYDIISHQFSSPKQILCYYVVYNVLCYFICKLEFQ